MKNTELALLIEKTDRRRALKKMGLGALGAAFLANAARAQIAINSTETSEPYPDLTYGAKDLAVLDFALNLEYLEAQFYSYAVSGVGIQSQGVEITGRGTQGTVTAPTTGAISFSDPDVASYAQEICRDEIEHVKFLRGIALAAGKQPIAMPSIDLVNSFTAAAGAAGLPTPFTPFDNDADFLLGAFIFEDVGVTAYHGAIAGIASGGVKRDLAGIMGTEAYHASNIRTLLLEKGLSTQANAISAARDSLGGAGLDQGITVNGVANIVPADSNGLVFARTPAQVLAIVYLSTTASKGGFFPNGVNS